MAARGNRLDAAHQVQDARGESSWPLLTCIMADDGGGSYYFARMRAVGACAVGTRRRLSPRYNLDLLS
jgi:hypothetical protein